MNKAGIHTVGDLIQISQVEAIPIDDIPFHIVSYLSFRTSSPFAQYLFFKHCLRPTARE
jgi:hypothetical protein